MLDISQKEEEELKTDCKTYLSGVPTNTLVAFSKSIFPVQTTPDPYNLFFINLNNFFVMQTKKNVEFDLIIQ